MAAETIAARPGATGVLGRLGAGVLDVLQILGEVTTLFVATARAVPRSEGDRQRLVAQLVRVGTDTLPIGALLSLFVGMVLVVQSADQLRNVSQEVLGPIVGLAMT